VRAMRVVGGGGAARARRGGGGAHRRSGRRRARARGGGAGARRAAERTRTGGVATYVYTSHRATQCCAAIWRQIYRRSRARGNQPRLCGIYMPAPTVSHLV
jgi:hypothetical protein